jgi:hypothetical protein
MPFLDVLGDDYAVPCDGTYNFFLLITPSVHCCVPFLNRFYVIFVLFPGTAFFPLQSCMNHSCCPNAKAFKRDEVMYIFLPAD